MLHFHVHLSFVLVVVGHDRIGERITCQIHVFIRSSLHIFFVVIHRLSALRKHDWGLIVLDDAVVLDEAIVRCRHVIHLPTVMLSTALILFDACQFSSHHRDLGHFNSSLMIITRYRRHHLLRAKDLLWSILGVLRHLLSTMIRHVQHLSYLLGAVRVVPFFDLNIWADETRLVNSADSSDLATVSVGADLGPVALNDKTVVKLTDTKSIFCSSASLLGEDNLLVGSVPRCLWILLSVQATAHDLVACHDDVSALGWATTIPTVAHPLVYDLAVRLKHCMEVLLTVCESNRFD